jgi:hypothetical protein
MNIYEAAAAPAVRIGEALLSGRRLAGRILPYGNDAGGGPRFDPVERRFVPGSADPVVHAGPFDEEAWAGALGRLPVGPVLVGPPSPGESVWGAGRAAAAAAVSAGRPVYLLDPEPAGLPLGLGGEVVLLCSWKPGRHATAFPGLAVGREAGLPTAALFPLLPGWTAEDDALEALAQAAARGGASALCGLVPHDDGENRRAMVEARAGVEPEAADRFFETIHHGDWPDRIGSRLSAARSAARRAGLAVLPPRPSGRGIPAGNAFAAGRLEEQAELGDPGEHRAALLYAAVRWIDESGRDLAAVVREGNFPRIFPFGGEIEEAASAAFLAAAR